ncbi:MAG: MFS transporter [Candidatus Heimdallarchaeota archaeon]|nr:MAG: MFS transporter [Candidatus Heimdallarchaeota archaeon]
MVVKTVNQESNAPMTTIVLLFASTLTAMATAAIAPALPEIKIYFQNVPNIEILVRLILTIPAFSIAMGAPFMGVIIDKWGRKNLLIVSTILYGVTGSSGFYLNSLLLIFIGRFLLGVAVAGIMTTSTALIADYYQDIRRNKVMGYQASFMAFGGVIFLTGSGFLAVISWQTPFLLYLGSLVLLPGMLKYLIEPKTESKQHINTNLDKKQRIPYKNVITIYLLIFVVQIFFFTSVTELPFFLTQYLSLNLDVVGITLASLTLSGGIVALFYNKVKQKFNFRVIFILAFGLFGMGFFMISLSTTHAFVILSLLIAGSGFGLLVPNITVWLVGDIPETVRGRILSGFTSFLFLGQFFSPLFSQTLLQFVEVAEIFKITGIALFSIGIIFLGLYVREYLQRN